MARAVATVGAYGRPRRWRQRRLRGPRLGVGGLLGGATLEERGIRAQSEGA
jgi:hypothetical protein